jgi:hypothetical protein
MNKEELQLFVWEDVFRDYTAGIAFAIAHDEEEAIKEILGNNPDYKVDELKNKEPQILPINKPYGNYVVGGG